MRWKYGRFIEIFGIVSLFATILMEAFWLYAVGASNIASMITNVYQPFAYVLTVFGPPCAFLFLGRWLKGNGPTET